MLKKLTLIKILKNIMIINDEYKDKGFMLKGVFGSYARHEENDFSDVDIAYIIDHHLFHKDDAFAKLEEILKITKRLENIFKRKVDLVSLQSNNIDFTKAIEKEIVTA